MRRRLRSNNTNILKLAMVGIVAMAGGFLLTSFMGSKSETQALSATEFQAGRIIDDSIFYNPNTMTAAEIDAFIDSHSPACDMWGTQIVYGNVTRAEYVKQLRAQGNSKYHDPPFVCVSEYYENPETHKTNFSTGGRKEAGMLSAGEIIYQAAHEYNINPQVLLVMLKKESYVWGDDWPHDFQYNTVMGYACPDGAPCDSKYFGFYNQVMMAAWQLNYYREHIYSYNYRPYDTNNILYNPDRSCGTKSVYLENIATTSLYIYTPYVPNDGALANYPGTSWCGSYGNRNFYMYFREWFGSTLGDISYAELETPRTFEVPKDTQSYNYATLAKADIEKEVSVKYMTTKTTVHNELYVSTGIGEPMYKYSDINEYTTDFEPMETPRYMIAPIKTSIFDSDGKKSSTTESAQKLFFSKKRYINGLIYLATDNSSNALFALSSLRELNTIDFVPLGAPRVFVSTNNTYFIDPETGFFLGKVSNNQSLILTTKMTVSGELCLRTAEDSNSSVNRCIPISTLHDTANRAGQEYVSLGSPRAFRTKANTTLSYTSGTFKDFASLEADSIIYYSKKTYIGQSMCLIPENDLRSNTFRCIPFENLEETSLSFIPMGTPRYLKVSSNSSKVHISAATSKVLPTESAEINQTLFFDEKIETSQGLCLRNSFTDSSIQGYCYLLSTLNESR